MTTTIIQLQTDSGNIGSILYEPTVKKTDALVVFFHGKGEFGDGSNATLQALTANSNHANLVKFAEKYGFRVLAPQVNTKLTGGTMWWTVPFIRSILKAAVKLTTLGQVGITGLSQGGGTVWMALTDYECAPLIFAAIPICPTAQYEGDFSLISKHKIEVWDFHGGLDKTCPPANSRNMVAKANSFNPDYKVILEIFEDSDHAIWGVTYNRENIYPWLLQFAPGGTAPTTPVDEVVSTYKITLYKSGKSTIEKL